MGRSVVGKLKGDADLFHVEVTHCQDPEESRTLDSAVREQTDPLKCSTKTIKHFVFTLNEIDQPAVCLSVSSLWNQPYTPKCTNAFYLLCVRVCVKPSQSLPLTFLVLKFLGKINIIPHYTWLKTLSCCFIIIIHFKYHLNISN